MNDQIASNEARGLLRRRIKTAQENHKKNWFNLNFAIETDLLQNSSRPIELIRLEKLTIGATDSSLDRGIFLFLDLERG